MACSKDEILLLRRRTASKTLEPEPLQIKIDQPHTYPLGCRKSYSSIHRFRNCSARSTAIQAAKLATFNSVNRWLVATLSRCKHMQTTATRLARNILLKKQGFSNCCFCHPT